jgi:chromosome partition protein MukB
MMVTMMNRASIKNLILINWNGFFYQRFEMADGVTALEGENGAGKTTVMIAAFVALLPDQRLLQFHNVSDEISIEGDSGIFGRLGPGGVAYTVLELLLPGHERFLAGVMIRKKAPPSLELTPFVIEGLSDDVSLETLLLTGDGETGSVPELSDLRRQTDALECALKPYDSVGHYTSRLFDLGVIPLRMEAYAERRKFNRMLQASLYGGLSSSIQKGLRDYLLAEDPSLRNHVARMRENLEACRLTRRELELADEKYKIVQSVYKSGYGMFEAGFHGTRLRVADFRRNADTSRADHQRRKSEMIKARKQMSDLEGKYAEVKAELEWRQREYGKAEMLHGSRKRAWEIATETERHSTLLLKVKENLEECEAQLRQAELRLRECERKRDGLLAEKEQNAAGMADAQKAWEQVSMKAALYNQAKEALNDAQRSLPDREVTEETAEGLLSECRDQWEKALETKTRIERELESIETRVRRYENVLNAVRRAAQKEVSPEQALETARALDLELREAARGMEDAENIPARMEEAGRLAARQREVRGKVGLLNRGGEKIETAADLRARFESGNEAQRALTEERTGFQDRLAELGVERARIEPRIHRLRAEAAEWREARKLAEKLEAGFEVRIGDGPALEELRTRVEEDLAIRANKLRRIEEERETARKKALDLEFAGGRLEESLVRLRDLVDGKLAAEMYDEVSEKEASAVEARLGPLNGALLVDDIWEAVQKIANEPDRPDNVWLMETTALSEIPEGRSYPGAELVSMGTAWRLTRHPERPVVGRAARDREIERLRAGVEALTKEIEVLHAEEARLREGAKTIEVLSRYWRFLGAPDPGESEVHLQERLSEITESERRYRRHMEEIELRIGHSGEVLRALGVLLPDAFLLDESDWDRTCTALMLRHKEAMELKKRWDFLRQAMEPVRTGWPELESPPPGPELLRARRQALEQAEAVLVYWSKGRELLSLLVDRLPHLSYGDQARIMNERASALEALKRQMGKVDEELQAAKTELERSAEELDSARRAFNQADASYTVLNEKIQSLRNDLAETGEDGSRERLDEASRSREEAKEKSEAARSAEREIYTELIKAEKDVQAAHHNTASARKRRQGDLEALRPHWRNWMSLKLRAVRERLTDRPMAPAVNLSYDEKGHLRAFEEASGHQSELKRILRSVPEGEDLWREVERLTGAQHVETRRGSQNLDAWLIIRSFLEKSIPRDIAQADDPEIAFKQIEDHLRRLRERLMDQETQLRQRSDTVANSIRTRIRREERQIHQMNKELEAISFGTIASIRIRLERVEAMQRLLDGLKMQKELFRSGMSLEEAMVELYRQMGGGQVRGDQLLDYREYVRMSVEVQRIGSDKWIKAASNVLSTGESIGVGAAVLMIMFEAWEHQAVLLRGKKDGGSLRFLFLDEAARLSPRSLDTLSELCERMRLQLLVAAPAADRARRGTAYRLIRQIGENDMEEVVVHGRRFTGD